MFIFFQKFIALDTKYLFVEFIRKKVLKIFKVLMSGYVISFMITKYYVHKILIYININIKLECIGIHQ